MNQQDKERLFAKMSPEAQSNIRRSKAKIDFTHDLGEVISIFRHLPENRGKDLKELNLFDFCMFANERRRIGTEEMRITYLGAEVLYGKEVKHEV